MSQQTIAAAAFLVLSARRKSRRKPRWWRNEFFIGSVDVQRRFFNKLLSHDQALFRNFSRMSLTDFDYILQKIGPVIAKCDTKFRDAIPVKIRLLVTLRFLATGDSYKSLMYLFRISSSAISKIVPEVCQAIVEALQDAVKMPQNESEWMRVANEFETLWNFPHCIGACDGKHIVMQCPQRSGSTYFNYKGTFSIVLMAVVDAKYCFTYFHIGCQGRISDGGVFRETTFYKKLCENQLGIPSPKPLANREKPSPYVIVADDAFPLQINIMKPFSGIQEQGSPQRVYNYRLSRARRVVENAFGLLASVFRIFRKPLLLDVKNTEIVSTACVYLHNFLLMSTTSRSLYSPAGTLDVDTQDGTVIDGAWTALTSGDTGMVNLRPVSRRPSRDAKEVREEFKEYFISDAGKVPWQDLYA